MYRIIIPILLAAGIGGLLAGCNKSSGDGGYELTPAETHALILSEEAEIAPGEVNELIVGKNNAYRFVDVRPVSDFERGHLEGAINVPIQNLLEPENLQVFEQEGKTVVLYGSNQLEANGPWLLLRQLGYEQLMVMQGGLQYVRAARDATLMDLPSFDDEAACCDYVALLETARKEYADELEATRPKQTVVTQPAPRKEIVPKKKRPAPEEEEGC